MAGDECHAEAAWSSDVSTVFALWANNPVEACFLYDKSTDSHRKAKSRTRREWVGRFAVRMNIGSGWKAYRPRGRVGPHRRKKVVKPREDAKISRSGDC